jgi:parallel beta-helix repeat protein
MVLLMRIIIGLFWLILGPWCPLLADAATRYVDNSLPASCVNGSTTYSPTAGTLGVGACGSGSSTIYNTAAGGMAVTFPGDTLLFRGGVYDSTLNVVNSGSLAGGVILISAYNSESVIFRPSSAFVFLLRFTASPVEYMIFRQLTFDGVNKVAPAFSGDTGPGSEAAISFRAGDNTLTFDRIYVKHSWANGIQGSANNITMVDMEISHSGVNNTSYDANGWYWAHLTNSTMTRLYGHDNECYAWRSGDSGPSDTTTNNTIDDSIFTANGDLTGVRDCSTSGGGGVVLYGTNQTLRNSKIFSNSWDGILLTRENSNSSANKIYNNTITGNTFVGLHLAASPQNVTGMLATNNLIVGNGTNVLVESGSTMTCTTNLIGTAVNSSCGNIAGGSIATYTVTASDFHLKTGTNAAVDTGTNLAAVTDDFDGVIRPVNGGVALRHDIGAYERTGAAPDTTPPAAPSGVFVSQLDGGNLDG